LSAAEHESSPAAVRCVVARYFERAWLKAVGAAVLIAVVSLQGHAQTAARDQQELSGAPPYGLLKGGRDPKGAPPQGASAEQRCLCALAYVLSPPPATRGVMPNYLPTISPKDAQPLPPVAADALPPRPAWRQAGRVRRPIGHQGRCRQGAQRHLAALPRPVYGPHAGSCRQERSVRRHRFHRHHLLPKAMRRHPGTVAPHGRSASPHAAKTRRFHHRIRLHSTNPIEQLSDEIKGRTEVVGIFRNQGVIVRLVDPISLEQNNEWAVSVPVT
jgi:hypothetical protein